MRRSTLFLFALAAFWISIQIVFIYALWGSVQPGDMSLGATFFIGLILLVGLAAGVSLLTHAFRNLRATRGPATNVILSARKYEDGESTTYKVIISAGTRRWISPAYGGRGVRYILANGRVGGRAWFDPQSGLPVSIEANGQAITTYPTVREVPGE